MPGWCKKSRSLEDASFPQTAAEKVRQALPPVDLDKDRRPDKGPSHPGSELWLRRQHPNDGHHALILVVENVAVINEVPNIGTAEVHPNPHARIGVVRVSVPERNLDHIHELALNGLYRLTPVDPEVVLG